MKAWQYIGAGQPLTLNEVPEPVAGPGEIAVAVKAAGLCHTDVGILEGTVPEWVLAGVPHTLGHEVAGVVKAVGEGASKFAVGDRVGLHQSVEGPGLGIPGGYAPTVTIREDLAVKLPDAVDFPAAAAGTDAGMTPYHAIVTVGAVTSGTKVGIIGLGGLGFNGVQIAVALGAEVYAAEPRESVHQLAKDFGVKEVVTDATQLEPFDLDVIVDFAGFGTTTAGAVLAIKPQGKIVLVGIGRNEATINTTVFMNKLLVLEGSVGGSLEDLVAYYELVAEGKVTPVISTTSFDEIKDGLEKVASGAVRGRLVAVYDES
jgi:alcohol dehydrogenase, propanol-preferring